MDVRQAYNQWADQYDSNHNRTRDLEAFCLRSMLPEIHFETCLEIGCGTGKNTGWLASKGLRVTAVDLSEEMIERGRDKIQSEKVVFIAADINREWNFIDHQYDLATFSLVLEHIEDLNAVFARLATAIRPGGYVYVGELHPFKQYSGTKARFETATGTQVVTCYTHHVSDFTSSAYANGFDIIQLKEFFDNDDRNTIPRILGIIFRKRMQG